MNTNKNIQNNQNEVRHYERSEVIPATIKTASSLGVTDKGKDNPDMVYEAKIITPQPYGIYALCKIMEHFQIN